MNKAPLELLFAPFEERMRSKDIPKIVIANFKHHYLQLVAGDTGLISNDDILPVTGLPDIEAMSDDYRSVGSEVLQNTIMIKLNGGLGTSMGMEQAKSLIRVKHDLCFLDIIIRQAECKQVPLLLMNSFATHADSLVVLGRYPALDRFGLDQDFLQHKVPKIKRSDLCPVTWSQAPDLEWNPPGHGDIYPSLLTSGMLDKLLVKGYRYAFISNSDNLGAVLDESLLGYLVKNQLPFLMEVADRTKADSKGGHLARRFDGQLILRESAQCPEGEMESFQDIDRYSYFNTNNIWLNLASLREAMAARGNVLGLSLIRNAKTVNPRDPDSTPVYQLETAMGSAISVFKGAAAIRVPRSRFTPVKTTVDLLLVQSDLYRLNKDYHLLAADPNRKKMPEIMLDDRYFRLIDDYEYRFPEGVPSLLACSKLEIEGDIAFARGVVLQGSVFLKNGGGSRVIIPAGAVITQEQDWTDRASE